MDEIRPTTNDAILQTKLVEVARRLGDIPKDSSTLIKTKEECKAAFESLAEHERSALVNIHARVKLFADAQRASVQDIELDIPGGKAGHTVSPCKGRKNKGCVVRCVVLCCAFCEACCYVYYMSFSIAFILVFDDNSHVHVFFF
jgi:hypothetical protein